MIISLKLMVASTSISIPANVSVPGRKQSTNSSSSNSCQIVCTSRFEYQRNFLKPIYAHKVAVVPQAPLPSKARQRLPSKSPLAASQHDVTAAKAALKRL